MTLLNLSAKFSMNGGHINRDAIKSATKYKLIKKSQWMPLPSDLSPFEKRMISNSTQINSIHELIEQQGQQGGSSIQRALRRDTVFVCAANIFYFCLLSTKKRYLSFHIQRSPLRGLSPKKADFLWKGTV